MLYAIYSKENGRINRLVSCPGSSLDLNVLAGEGVLPCPIGVTDATHYVKDELGLVVPKEDYSLGCLPLPCTITIEGLTYNCTEQPTFEFDAPGIYTIRVDAGPMYLEKEFPLDYQP